MTAEERLQILRGFHFTDRQARFLSLVMRHAGVCVPRQFATFAGIQNLEWWEFYDVCEELLRISKDPEPLATELEALFVQEGLPYRIDTDGIHWRLSEPAEASRAQATRLLVERADLGGPAEQWDKAQGHLAARPPDPENCIKIDPLPGFRGDQQGIGHGATDALDELTAEAELVLHWCAAGILYLVKKSE